MHSITLSVQTSSKTELLDITDKINKKIESFNIVDGVCMLFVPHTTAGITINESADPSVKQDILMVLNKIIPWKENYKHLEGNSPAHIKTSLVGSSELINIQSGKMVLGTWQGVFFCEFDGPRNRKLNLTIIN